MAIKFLNTVAVDTDVLYVDASSNNVGIGTTSPTRKLTVNGSANVFDSLFVNSNTPTTDATTDAELVIQAKGNQAGTIRSSQWYFQTIPDSIYGNSAFRIAKNYDGGATSEFMRINSSGNVGIGTTNPSEKLEVAGNARITGDVTLSNGNALRWTSDDVRIEGTTAGDNIKFYVANTEILQLAQSGTLATVTGNLRVTGAYYDSSNSSGTSGQVLSSTATGTDWVSLSEISGVDGTGTTNYLAKWSDSDTITDSVIYDNGTNVGIGTTSPTHLLTLETASSPSIKIKDTTQGATLLAFSQDSDSHLGTYSAHPLVLDTNSTERIRITSTGNVGIGTTSPGQKLDVVGGFIRSISTGANLVQGAFVAQSSTTDSPGYRGQGYFTHNQELDVSWYMGTPYTNGDMFVINRQNTAPSFDTGAANMNGTNVDNFFAIKNNGNVGIGTTSPYGKLNVIPSSNPTTPSAANQIVVGESSANSQYNLRIGYFLEGGAYKGSIQAISGNTPNTLILNGDGGNVGIGTTSPGHKLDVLGGSGNDVIARFKTTGAGTGDYSEIHVVNNNDDRLVFGSIGSNYASSSWAGMRYVYANTGDLGLKATQGSGNVRIYAGGSSLERMRITSGGNVGIGTTSPQQNLQVASPSSTSVVLGASYLSTNNNNFFEVGILSNDGYLNLRNSGVQTTVHIDSDGNSFFNGGNVGIGATSPNRSLHVIGQVAIDNSTSPSGGLLVSPDGISNKVYSRTGNATTSAHPLDFISGSSTSMRIATNGNVGIGTTSPSYKLDVSGGARAGGVITYSKSAGSLDTTGYAVAGLTTSFNGASAGFTFTCFGHGGYQKVVYSCYNVSGTWNTIKVIDEGTNAFDVEASANATTITFTFKSTSGTKNYTPRVTVEATGSAINSTYA